MAQETPMTKRHGITLSLPHLYIVFRIRSGNRPTMLWWRRGPRYTNGPGWYIRYKWRPGDYLIFSEREGIVKYRKCGPLEWRRLDAINS